MSERVVVQHTSLKEFVEAVQDDSTGAGVGTRRGSTHPEAVC